MKNLNILITNSTWQRIIFCLFLILWELPPSLAQLPSVRIAQNLSFGAFTQGSSEGKVTVLNDGTRIASGGVILLNLGQDYHPALFDVTAPPGTIISISNGPDVNLVGNLGGTMTLHPEVSAPASPFTIDPTGTTRVIIGGTLTVGNPALTPSGGYTGTFYITFNNE